MVILGYVRLMIKLTTTTAFLNPPLAAPLLTMAPTTPQAGHLSPGPTPSGSRACSEA